MPRANLDLWANRDTNKVGVYRLPKKLDEEVARLHLDRIGVKLTKLTDKLADCLCLLLLRPLQAGALSVLSEFRPPSSSQWGSTVRSPEETQPVGRTISLSPAWS